MENNHDDLSAALFGFSNIIIRFSATSIKISKRCGEFGSILYLACRHIEAEGTEVQMDRPLHWMRELLNDMAKLLIPRVDPDHVLQSIVAFRRGGERTLSYNKIEQEIQAGLKSVLTNHGKLLALRALSERIEQFNSQHKEALNTYEHAPVTRLSSSLEDLTAEQSLAYDVLDKHLRCACISNQVGAIHEAHLGNLFLRPEISRDEKDCIRLEMLFYSHKQSHGSQRPCWQDVSLQVTTRLPLETARLNQNRQKMKRARFGDEKYFDQDTNQLEMLAQGPEIGPNELCRRLLGETSVQICFQITGTKLRLADPSWKSLGRFVKTTPSLSLHQVLSSYCLTMKMKVSLAYILARSVWQFYDSSWMRKPWSSELIHFVVELKDQSNKDETFLYTQKPYLVLRFDDGHLMAQKDELQNRASPALEHLGLIALGIMLVEIGQGHPLPRDPNVYQELPEDTKLLRDLTQALICKTKSQSWPGFESIPDGSTTATNPLQEKAATYLSVVEKCLISAPLGVEMATIKSNTESSKTKFYARRKLLYKAIVAPLEDLMKRTSWYDKIDTIEAAEPSKVQTSVRIKTHVNPASLQDNINVSTEGRRAQKWLQTVYSLHERLGLNQHVKTSTKVCVTILDTGYDPKSTFFNISKHQRRVSKNNWLDLVEHGNNEPVDIDGHGTAMVSLVIKMAPYVTISMARIAKRHTDGALSSENVAKAIRWASDRGSHIVLMSFGFENEQKAIKRAIYDTLGRRNLIFVAAASNSGGDTREMFPARHESVISVHATDADGQTQNFNPPRNPNSQSTFCTLGVQVPCASLKRVSADETYLTGTSVAAGLVAGLCAMLLLYVDRNHTESAYSVVKEKIQSREGMENVLRELSAQKEYQYHYIRPWQLKAENANECWMQVAAAAGRDS